MLDRRPVSARAEDQVTALQTDFWCRIVIHSKKRSAGVSWAILLCAFANGLESDKIVGMTAPVASKIFADRIGRIEVSATMAVTAEAARLRAQGAQLVDFGAGEPHFATPRHIKDAAIAAIESNFTRYTVVAGIPELRKAIVQRHACDFGSDYTPDETVFTTGGKLALFNAIQVLVDHGDEVILPVPYWVSFKDIIQYAGGKVVYLPTEEAENFRVTADAIERAITPRTKVIILNTPSNPSGSVVSSGDLEVKALNKIGLQSLALAGAGSSGSSAVGGAIVVNVFPDVTTEAFIDSGTSSHVTQIDVLKALTISAKSSLVEAPAPVVQWANGDS